MIFERVPCLSDGAIQALRADLAEAKAGEPMTLAWGYVSKALDEIEWLRGREAELEHSLADAMKQIEALQSGAPRR